MHFTFSGHYFPTPLGLPPREWGVLDAENEAEQVVSLLIAERDRLSRAIEAMQGPVRRRSRSPATASVNGAASAALISMEQAHNSYENVKPPANVPPYVRLSDLLRAWSKVLKGQRPALSIEITTKCPLRCPGCYAYEEAHLGEEGTLRSLTDHKGDELIRGVLELVDRLRPLHLSIVGGDPLVRYRELESLIPQLLKREIHVQVVTSAFRPLPWEWKHFARLALVVSIDGLAAEHNVRRAPATYDRILRNIAGQRITVHCTITGPMMRRSGYLREFLEFWTPRAEVRRVWFSLFTPQTGDHRPEILLPGERQRAIADMIALRRDFPKLDMSEALIRQFAAPPKSPHDCVFARTTETITANLRTRIQPCQFGGNPDCSACGCMASMGLAAIAERRLAGILSVRAIFKASAAIGQWLVHSAVTPDSRAVLR